MDKVRVGVAAALAVASAALTACSSTDSGTASADPTNPAGATGPLRGVCPATVVIQTDWYATPERAAAYQLVGPNGTIDAKKGSYRGPLGATGIEVEVRLGGPFIGFQPIPAQMYQDESIYLGYVATDDAVQAADKFPTTAVVAPLDINPQILMWDPSTYTIDDWPDVANTDAKVVYLEGLPFMDYLVSKGYVKPEQLDASFDGTPSRFVAERGGLIQQGYASNEPYRWEHDVPDWMKPVDYLLVHDAGYEIYPQGLAVRSDTLTDSSACLKELVPMIQQAQVDYVANPGPTNDTLVKIAEAIGDGPPITAAANADAVTVMTDLGIVGNGSNSTLGDFDLARVDRTIGVLGPIFAARNTDVPPALAATDIVTNEFIDQDIHL
ncbi:ABC transporter substrate-binding protein [Frankia sp. CNm7]|uniref:Nitrate ABC transporter substrate-binding protein n=1 Tax=Frankia nepalensis TaxID=1836974 RepID=A0A937URT7_9ACTN|nr:hypothetical protein [Frankia nepalensis]MBL7495806.1 ABC transporter substrate-binding protein [Frankia nepalensis]MBL7513260.1 ABC transporter substrate-binding protein [Frankia nepalensis]MBL7523788.1 ABC transporter substrate-binding protein [Frankia nepalensis]MBL7628141.1 hypothetical protein [Frankia nepalensis]